MYRTKLYDISRRVVHSRIDSHHNEENPDQRELNDTRDGLNAAPYTLHRQRQGHHCCMNVTEINLPEHDST